jgi:hypothetical protein
VNLHALEQLAIRDASGGEHHRPSGQVLDLVDLLVYRLLQFSSASMTCEPAAHALHGGCGDDGLRCATNPDVHVDAAVWDASGDARRHVTVRDQLDPTPDLPQLLISGS